MSLRRQPGNIVAKKGFKSLSEKKYREKRPKVNDQNSIIYYIADLPVTRLRLLTNKSFKIAVPYASLRSLILLLSSSSFAFFDSLHSWDAQLRLA